MSDINALITQNEILTAIQQNSINIEMQNPAEGLDHGGLSGLSDDDHLQYLLTNGTRSLSGNWNLGNYGISGANYLGFNQAYLGSSVEGRLQWNSEDGCLEVGMPGGNSTLQIGLEMYLPKRAKNTESIQINNGQIVYLSGFSGSVPEIKLANASNASESQVIGIATENIPAGQQGWVTTYGIVRDVNTSGFSANDTLYLSTIDGEITNTIPTSPNYAVKIGVAGRIHATEGQILVNIDRRVNNFANIAGLTAGSIPYADSYGWLTQDNNNFSWNNSTGTLTTASDFRLQTGTNKTFILNNCVYRDENFSGFEAGATANEPDAIKWKGTSTIYTRGFDGSSTSEQLFAGAELQHDYQEGSDLIFHIHWCPTTAGSGSVKWNIDYTIERDNVGTMQSGTLSVVDSTDGVAWIARRINIGTILGTDLKIGDQIAIRLYRNPSDSEDTYTADAGLSFTFGYHYCVDSLGSRLISSK